MSNRERVRFVYRLIRSLMFTHWYNTNVFRFRNVVVSVQHTVARDGSREVARHHRRQSRIAIGDDDTSRHRWPSLVHSRGFVCPWTDSWTYSCRFVIIVLFFQFSLFVVMNCGEMYVEKRKKGTERWWWLLCCNLFSRDSGRNCFGMNSCLSTRTASTICVKSSAVCKYCFWFASYIQRDVLIPQTSAIVIVVDDWRRPTKRCIGCEVSTRMITFLPKQLCSRCF